MEAHRPPWLPRDLYPFESRYRDIDGARIHYIDEGAGPPILFLHGNPTWSFLYRNLVLGLREDHRCIAVDLPGFGLSAAAPGYGYTPAEHAGAVQRFVTDLDLGDVTLMAHDWGGPIGLTVATRESERFSGFILGNTWAWPLNGIVHFESASRVMGGPVGRLMIRYANAFVNVMIPLGTSSHVDGRVLDCYRKPFADFDGRRPMWEFAQQLLRSEPFMKELDATLPQVTHLPALFLWGGGDFALREGIELPRFEKLFPNHDTVVLDNARHFFQEDAPDECVEAIKGWMSSRR